MTNLTISLIKTPALIALVGFMLMSCQLLGYESAYEKTPSGEIEIKSIPQTKVLVTEEKGTYFQRSNQLFRRLFNYIKEHDVEMTIPVEARMNNAQMLFYVGSKDKSKKLEDNEAVKVKNQPSRLVASVGARGSYTENNFAEAKAKLEEWLKSQSYYKSLGEPYAVYWNGPFVPGFMKRFEVHIPVEIAGSTDLIAKASGPQKPKSE
ncbi:MAG: heme-binding protein [Planctomycetota bacterium]|jgi:DNA gyrase inhibitor GyrI